MSYARYKELNNEMDLTAENNTVDEFIYIHTVSPGSEVVVYRNEHMFKTITSGRWIGVIDGYDALNGPEKVKWRIRCKVTSASVNNPIRVVYFPVEKLKKKVFKNKKYGRDIQQTLEALWLEDNSRYIHEVR